MEILGNVSELAALSFRHPVAPNKQVTVIPHELYGPTTDIIFKLPENASSDTLVGIGATQTLTNKTLTSPTINGGSFSGSLSWSGGTISNATITGSTITGGSLAGLNLSTLTPVSLVYVNSAGTSLVTTAASPVAYNVVQVASTGLSFTTGTLALDNAGTVGASVLKLANGGTGTGAGFTTNGVLLGGATSLSATAAGAAYQSLRIPSGGGAPAFGAIDLSQSAAVVNALPIANGGTGATTAATARTNLSAAQSGANTDITSLNATGDVKGGSLYTTSAAGIGLELTSVTSAPASPAAGYRLYTDSTSKRLYAKDPSGGAYRLDQEWVGDPTAIINPTDSYTNWINGTGGTYTLTTAVGSSSPLYPSTQKYISITATANITNPTTANSVAYQGTLLPALANIKLRAEFAVTTPSSDSWRFDIFIDGVRAPLSTDDPVLGYTTLPAGYTGFFVSLFDAGASTSTYTYAFSRISGTGTTTLLLTNFVINKGRLPQAPAIQPWTSAGAPTTSWVTGVNTASSYVKYRRIGDSAEIYYYIILNAAPTAATLTLTLPNGYTIDTNKVSNSQYITQVGSLEIATAASGTSYSAQLLTNGTTNTLVAVYQSATTGAQSLVTNTVPISFASGNILTARVLVPIVGWSSTVNLGQNDEEYLSYDSVLTQLVVGPQGSLVPNLAAGSANQTYALTYLSPAFSDTRFDIEFQLNGSGPWVAGKDCFPGETQSIYNFGARITSITSLAVSVSFGGGGALATNNTYANPTGATGWSSYNASGTRWRLRKNNSGGVAGFGIVRPGISSGLVSSLGFPANNTGNLTSSGYVGEVVESLVTGTTSVGATTTYWDATNISFSGKLAGVYQVEAVLTWVRNGATVTSTDLELALLTSSGAVAPAAAQLGQSWVAENAVGTSTTFTRRTIVLPGLIVRWTGTQLIYAGVTATASTLYLKAYTGAWSTATPQYGARLTAVRIA